MMKLAGSLCTAGGSNKFGRISKGLNALVCCLVQARCIFYITKRPLQHQRGHGGGYCMSQMAEAAAAQQQQLLAHVQ